MSILAAKYPTYPMFDRRTRWLYGLLAGSILLEIAILFALGLQIGTGPTVPARFWPPLIFGAWGARRIGFDRLATSLEAVALLYGQGLALWLSTILLATVSGPLADGWLASADHWLGFNWVAYFQMTRPYLDLLSWAYGSFQWLPAVIIIGLAIEFQSERIWQFVTAALASLIIAIAIFPFAPAASPIVVYQISDPEIVSAAKFWPVMTALREGGVRTIGPEHLVGMVSFPSYHTAAAIQFVWAAWGSRWLRGPVAAICVLMALAIPTIGDHYLVDMIGGAALGIATIPLAKRLVRAPVGKMDNVPG